MSANQPTNAEILREIRQIKSDVGQIKEGQTALQISVAKIVTWQKGSHCGTRRGRLDSNQHHWINPIFAL